MKLPGGGGGMGHAKLFNLCLIAYRLNALANQGIIFSAL
jgi:hypothetical protein